MLGPKKQDKQAPEKVETFIAHGVEFEGNIKLTDGTVVRVDGKVIGDVKGRASLIVGKSAEILGNLELERVVIYGKIEGNIKAKDVDLQGGVVKGDITAEVLHIERGSIFNGKCVMEEASKGGQSPQ
ncbi:polymer-forming cytoskeletal protein [Hydrogenobacter sp. T-2]|uniref:bactofilin family protein n=1 Tax=Pampinifervens diazotrophicum TaxID=1632018 RepID=UPI002B2586A0|nr:polymer-forming cytoskeletal protein [Hydrogenobacter sp. T-2]WPM32241.1 polymer-forming cytoskeletal protein [Hydrogenobacter sp. T-2]